MWLMVMAAFGGNYEVLEGPRPARDFQRAVNTRIKPLTGCLQESTTPAKFHVTVGADGYVSAAKYSLNGETDETVLQCVYSEALKLRLVPNSDATPTTYVWMASIASISEVPEKEGPKPGEVWIDGVHTEVQVREVLDRNAQAFDFCKRKATAMDVAIPKTLTAMFKIGPDGKVSDAGIHKHDPDVFTECVVSRLAGLSFAKPPTPGATQVYFPFSFTGE